MNDGTAGEVRYYHLELDSYISVKLCRCTALEVNYCIAVQLLEV